VWTENVPFNETRDYVKKVLANAAIYDAVLTGQPVSLSRRLGPPIGPSDAGPLDDDLP
jgi:soluble lytic murein transglycosylase